MRNGLNNQLDKPEIVSRRVATKINPLIGSMGAEDTMGLVAAALAFLEDIAEDDNETHIEHYAWGRSLLIATCRKALSYEIDQDLSN